MCLSPIRYGSYISPHSWYIVVAYLDLHGSHWTNSSPGGDVKLVQKTMMTAEHVWGVVWGEALLAFVPIHTVLLLAIILDGRGRGEMKQVRP